MNGPSLVDTGAGARAPHADDIKRHARSLGFSLVGITDSAASRHTGFYGAWVGDGRHGEMGYLAREDSRARRADLRLTMESVRSVVVVAHEYYEEGTIDSDADPGRGIVARYARGDDYHEVVKKKLVELLEWLDGATEGGVAGRAYVDTGPILERELAQRAGLGWFGRNTMLINPERGSYFFLGVLLVDLALPSDAPFTEDRCGTCRACLDACPTGALLGRDADGAPVMDARRCISYLTIELRGSIPEDLRPGIGNRIFGCDICQEVCPWNGRFARVTEEPAYATRPGLDGPALVELAERLMADDDEAFRKRYRSSPLRRTGRVGLLRNVCVALGNWGSPEAIPTLSRVRDGADALAAEHAEWALARIVCSDPPGPRAGAEGRGN